MKEHVGASFRPLRRDRLGLVVAEATDAGAHDHRGWRDAIDPTGVVSGAGDDVRVAVVKRPRRFADSGDAVWVEGNRIECADLGDVDRKPDLGGNCLRARA